jgi:TRAP-type C4-dicarboxylate transport system permease small subunit
MIKIIAIVLIVAGALGLAYGGFTYTQATHEAKLGPVGVSVDEKQTVNVPLWVSAAVLAVGGALLLFGGKLT